MPSHTHIVWSTQLPTTLHHATLPISSYCQQKQVQKKMSMIDFIGNLKGLNEGSSDFPKDMLSSFFHSITSNPLPNPLASKPSKQDALDLSVNPFLTVSYLMNCIRLIMLIATVTKSFVGNAVFIMVDEMMFAFGMMVLD